MRTILILVAALGAAGCGGGDVEKTLPGNGAAPAVQPAATPAPAPTPTAAPVAKASATEVKNDNYSFEYRYPAEAAAVAPLARWLDGRRATLIAELDKDTAEFRKEAEANGFPYRAYESTTAWSVVTETPRFLSLSSEFYVYTGGAHGSPGFESIMWDKAAGQRLEPTALFISPTAIETALGPAFCDALDRQRAARRGAPVVRSDDPFNDCPKVAETTLILGSTDRRAIDRVGLLVGPYVAGPYAEGTFDITLPVTRAVLTAVKPAYREAFAAR